ncbi:MAG: PucC family protein [Heyndrickxia sp.]
MELQDVLQMNSSRKEIIINEITYWKQHQMLPEHYCDFLLALYTEGETQASIKSHDKHLIKNSLVIFLSLAALSLSVFVIYFTEFNFVLQTMILTSFVVLLLLFGIYYSKKKYWYTFFYIGAAIQLLLLSVFLNDKLFHNGAVSLSIMIIINCLIWILTGWKLKQYYFIFSGIIGIIVLVFYISV